MQAKEVLIISERLARREVILAFGLGKRSGHPEQWPKTP